MPFVPHTNQDIEKMLSLIGVESIDDLFDEIPSQLRAKSLGSIPDGLNEMQMMRLMEGRAQKDAGALCFIGAGAYQHHIPAAVWDVATRGEFLTAYTPYQAEASQGTLQLIYEYQSMICQLTGLAVSNASLYDGASGLAEAVLMAVRANKKSKSKKVLLASSLHPLYRKVVASIVSNQQIELEELPICGEKLCLDHDALDAFSGQDYAALVIAQPNFFGSIEDVNTLTDWGHENGMLVIGVVNPVALAMLAPPGEWGGNGADIAVGEGQPLGLPLASGGPYFGFISCSQKLVRQMPGRIIGRTVDLEGKEGFTLTLQAREQHIRRSKATSNICTNQGLAVTAATIFISLLGYEGLSRVAGSSHQNARLLAQKLESLEGLNLRSSGYFFHEFVVELSSDIDLVLKHMASKNVLAGFDLSPYSFAGVESLSNCLLVCVTEVKTEEDLDAFVEAMKYALDKGDAQC